MNRSKYTWLRGVIFGITFVFLSHGTLAANLEQIQSIGEKKIEANQKSQGKIDKIVAGAQERLIQYRSLLKQIEGLEAYNKQLSTQVASQENLIQRFDESITQVALIERQMSPLVAKMADSLEKFVELDLPFHTAERQERMAFIQDNLVAADVDVAEKFRQVIEAYQIENEYGRKIDSYQDIVKLNGIDQEVDVLRVGRIALVSQTKDTKTSASWNNGSKTWDVLDNVTYRNAIRQGIKMAKKQASIDILTLPIAAPEVVQ
ncbi:MAG: DUF3450 domain-containing protein [Gammaproteobacteria bacterium]